MGVSSDEPFYVVLLGAPGAGKGTQAALLMEKLGLPHVASGDLFRENIKAGTELGLLAKTFMDAGDLVPDEVSIGMVRQRLSQADCAGGAILDGFPRTISQAEAFDEVLAELGGRLQVVPYIWASEEVLLARLAGRWTCRNCGAVFHELFNPPQSKGVCDECGGKLYQRTDDTPETQRRRIEVYLEQTAPLIEYYRQRGLLAQVDGQRSVEEVLAALLEVVQKVWAAQREATTVRLEGMIE
jgi:adenylate kinase